MWKLFFLSQMSDAEMKTLLLDVLFGPTADIPHRYVEPMYVLYSWLILRL